MKTFGRSTILANYTEKEFLSGSQADIEKRKLKVDIYKIIYMATKT